LGVQSNIGNIKPLFALGISFKALFFFGSIDQYLPHGFGNNTKKMFATFGSDSIFIEFQPSFIDQ